MKDVIKKQMNGYEAVIIPADTIKGVHIPFLSFYPVGDYVGDPVLMFNDDKNDDLDASAEAIMDSVFSMANLIGISGPLIVPVLPSGSMFTESLKKDGVDLQIGDSKTLCRECFSPLIPPKNQFYRLDQQISRIIISVGMNRPYVCFGHGRSGIAAMRYAMIEPAGIKKVVVGGNDGYIPIISGKDAFLFDYPLGVRDMDVLFGKSYKSNRRMYSHIDYNFYVGEQDLQQIFSNNDDFCSSEIQYAYEDKYGSFMKRRMYNVMLRYEKALLNVYVKIYDGDHSALISRDDFNAVVYHNASFDEFPSTKILNSHVSA